MHSTPDQRTNSGITLSANFVFKRFNQVIDGARVAENGPHLVESGMQASGLLLPALRSSLPGFP
jgi:hypothetical protein